MIALIEEKREQLEELCRRFHVRRLSLFGSALRDDFDPEKSDLDFLVDLEPGRTLFDLSGLLLDLEALLNTPVDVVTERGLRPRVRQRVLEEAVPL